jgi:hypothetical protein
MGVKRAQDDREVTAPNGQQFIVGWASPRDVERTFGRGQWGIQVMQRRSSLVMPVVHMQQVTSASTGEWELRRLAAAIESGEWTPPASLRAAGTGFAELPRWAWAPFTFVFAFVGFWAYSPHHSLPSAAVEALLFTLFAGVLAIGVRRTMKRSEPPNGGGRSPR